MGWDSYSWGITDFIVPSITFRHFTKFTVFGASNLCDNRKHPDGLFSQDLSKKSYKRLCWESTRKHLWDLLSVIEFSLGFNYIKLTWSLLVERISQKMLPNWFRSNNRRFTSTNVRIILYIDTNRITPIFSTITKDNEFNTISLFCFHRRGAGKNKFTIKGLFTPIWTERA